MRPRFVSLTLEAQLSSEEDTNCYCPICEPSMCPACGDYIDYCQGHGPIGDPEGARIIEQHYEADQHQDCHPAGCEYNV